MCDVFGIVTTVDAVDDSLDINMPVYCDDPLDACWDDE